ncbi:MAG: TldD/PmbA family protein [Planctomycetota bacterium]|nr:TldD/PmbA family protein [Planctomycetota bacterium]
MNQSEALETLEKVLRHASADTVVATLSGEASSATRMADNVITQNVRCSSVHLYVECAYGLSHGGASTDDLSADALLATVQRAQAIAKVSPPDPEYMPPVEAPESRKYLQVRGYADATAGFSPQDKAGQLAAAARQVQAAGMRLSGGYPSGAYFQALANSAGLRAYHAWTEANIHATVLAPAGSGWAETVCHDTAGINVEQTVEAKATDEERTYLRGKLGTKVFGDRITIRSDPAASRCPGTPFQGDGLASLALPWVENGVVRNLCYSRYWAKKQGKQPTGWPSNLLMEGGDATVEQMIATMKRGLLITRFWYIRHVDPMIPLLTGMTRDGLFLVENGKVTRPVQHMRFNENMVDMFNRVEMLGQVVRTSEYPLLAPALKVKAFNFTSTTKF